MDNEQNRVLKIDLSMKSKLLIVLIWIGIWGIFDNLINLFIKEDNYKFRIVIYVIILFISLYLFY